MNPRYPVMAAVLAASLAPYAPGTALAETPQTRAPLSGTDTPSCPPSATETNALNVLSAIVACNTPTAARKDIGDKLIAFVLSADARGPLFVSKALYDSIPADKRTAAGIAGVLDAGTDPVSTYYKAIRAWVSAAKPSEVAELYFVMGDGAPPAWATANNTLKTTLKAATSAENDFRRGLVPGLIRRWRQGTDGAGNEGKIPFQAEQINQTGQFLYAAALDAHGILNDPRTPRSVVGSVDENNRPPLVPGGPRRASTLPAVPAASPYGGDDMYRDGGVGGNVSGPRDSNSAPYYMKMETMREASGDLKTYVAVYDLSIDPPYIRRVPITARGDNPIRHAGDRWNLVVNITDGGNGDLNITLHRPGDDSAAEGISTTAGELARARYDQAVSKATLEDGSMRLVKIGGQDYVVSRQGNGQGDMALFFPAGLQGADWRALRPSAAVIVGRVGPDGDSLPVNGKPDLGRVNGQPYHLEMENGAWAVKDGPGDQPRPATPTNTGTATTTDPNAAAANNAATLNNAEGWTDLPDNLQPDQATRGLGYRIQTKTHPTEGVLFKVLTPANFDMPGGNRNYAGVRNLRGLGHYIAYETDQPMTQGGQPVAWVFYQDLKVSVPLGTDRKDFAIVAQVLKPGTAETAFSSTPPSDGAAPRMMSTPEPLFDALERYLGYSAADLGKVRTRVSALVNNRPFAVTVTKTPVSIVITVGGATTPVWPEHASNSGAPGDNPQTPGGTGQLLTNDVVLTPASPGNADLPAEISPATGVTYPTWKNGGGSPPTAVVYRRTGAGASASDPDYYLRIKVRDKRDPNNPSLSGNLPVFVGHAAPNKDAVSMRGYADFPGLDIDASSSPHLVQVRGTGAAKGVWVLAPKGGPVKEDNCAGPVLWWGVGDEAAAKRIGCSATGRIE